MYIHYNCPKLWQSEYVIPTPDFTIVTDAVFSVGGVQYFLEVDRLQKMNANFEKLKNYKQFHDTGEWQKRNGGRFPVVLFYTEQEHRKHQLLEKNPGIKLEVLTKPLL